MQKGIKAYKIERFIRKKQQIQSVFFHLVLFPLSLSLSFSFFFWGGSSQLIWDSRGSPPPPKKNSCEEEGHHILQELPVKSHQPPFPIKNERFPVPRSLQVPLFKETLPFLVPLDNILFHCWSTMIRIGPIPEKISKCRWHRVIVILGDIPLSPPITPSLQL